MLAGILLWANFSFAQQSGIPAKIPAKHISLLSGLLHHAGLPESAGKETGGVPSERLIAQSMRDSLFTTLYDSISLGYSGNHFSTYDCNTMIYAFNYPYNSSPVFNNNGGIFGRPQVLFDTFTRWAIDPNTLLFGYAETAYATYDANMNIRGYLDLFADSAINPNMRYLNKFDTAKMIDTGLAFIWKSGVSDSAFRQFYRYNTGKKLLADSIYEYHHGAWKLASRTIYTYDASNDLVQIDNYTNDTDTSFLLPLVEKYKYTNTYDASHRLLSVASSYFDGTTLAPYIRDSFTYSGAIAYHNTWKEYQWDPINGYWAPMFYMHKYISTTTSLPDSVYIDGFDSILNNWIPQTKYIMSYDAMKNPVKLLDYEYDFTAFQRKPAFITTYYYGPYSNTTELKNAPVAANGFKIFPNPATDNITITNPGLPAHVPVSVALVNAGGQVMSRTGFAWQDGASIPLTNLVPGMYRVFIYDAAGRLLHQQAVVKQ